MEEKKEDYFSNSEGAKFNVPVNLNGNIKNTIISLNEWLSEEPESKLSESEINTLAKTIKETLNRAEDYVYTTTLNSRELNRFCEEARALYRCFELLNTQIGEITYDAAYLFYRGVDDKLIATKRKYSKQLDEFKARVYDGLLTAPKEEIENEFPHIFRDSFAYSLFLEMKRVYVKKGEQRNFSNLWYNMLEDQHLVCRQNDYVKFLIEQFDIRIERVVSNAKDDQLKTALYNSIKENLLKQSYKSTI
ncbi:hypothetical protein [Flagellimonas myxillae]|uniref:hypothetical protein n=1 Tax=Flagellimonas myxillae TaxID=2942214 RepID=UPI00201F0231|nr:hypothetical protein [Muricauda myxillae]MCL6266568.1 hypothetical protein [Muricauda myxillae]